MTLAVQSIELLKRYQEIRHTTEELCKPLSKEDMVIQSMADVSPTKWHLAHTSWFFETFVLEKFVEDYKVFHPKFSYIFNSYYNAVGERHKRPQRGLLSRPTVDEIIQYRKYVDHAIAKFLGATDEEEMTSVMTLGFHHEQQHQELLLTDIKHVLSCNPLYPEYKKTRTVEEQPIMPLEWFEKPEGLYEVGHEGEAFAYDNEGPRHRIFLEAFQVASRLITNAEYLEFIKDKGYQRPELWLSDGWDWVTREKVRHPLYWKKEGNCWQQMTLSGLRPLLEAEPVSHVSFYEAEAFARWAGARLAREEEWEVIAWDREAKGNFRELGFLHALPLQDKAQGQFFGDLWEWTASAYAPYPGYKAPEGAFGEYNGKFMCNQMVLRGGSCVTPQSHIRPTYRNFFYPASRWQFTGIRLAKNA